MKNAVAHVAVHFEGDRLVAVEGRRRAGRVTVERWLSAPSPKDLDASDAAKVGLWIGQQLEQAGMRSAARRGVVFSASRGEVVLKRIAVPPGVSDNELPALVRLQMLRQMTVAGESPVIDFFSLSAGRAGPPAAPAAAGEVMAAAMPSERMAWRRALADAAGVKLARIALAAEGVAALLAGVPAGRASAALGLALGPVGCELIVVESGRLVFARGVDAARAENDPASAAAALAVEAKRTWISYRSAPESAEVESTVVLGADTLAQAVAQAIGASLEMPSTAVDLSEAIEWPADAPSERRSALAPLAALLGQPEGEGLNFVDPHVPAPLAEIRRRRVLLGALVLVLASGAAYTLGSRDLSSRRAELDSLRQQWAELKAKHDVFLREKARVEHLGGFVSNRADWIAHLGFLNQQLADPHDAVVDELRCRLDAETRFEIAKDAGKSYPRGKWVPWSLVTFDLNGSVKRPEIRDELRNRLANDSRYLVDTVGTDVEGRFDLRLTAQASAAPMKREKADPSDKPVDKSSDDKPSVDKAAKKSEPAKPAAKPSPAPEAGK